MRKNIFALLLILAVSAPAAGQNRKKQEPKVKNVILLIGDGMGLSHVAATTINQNYEPLSIERAQFVGLQKTFSANNRVTDSAAAGTALATGNKTNNGMIGMTPDKTPVKNTVEKAEEHGLATGIVVTYAVTHATPAAFIAHVESRSQEEKIAEFYLKTEVDVFLGGGKKFFTQRKDGRDLTKELEAKGYTMAYDLDGILSFKDGRLAGLMAPNSMPKMSEGRGDYLPLATEKALELLKNNPAKGFFLMVEGSMIDGGGHANDIRMVIDETIDFDKAVKVAFDFADRNPGTLVVVTADHETGGLTLPSGKPDFLLPDQGVKYEFSTGGHTGAFVPVYSYGPGAEHFSGIMDNTDIPKKINKLLGIE